jgi:GntR family transcriptional repressor for pyruvate dehydrogenase complex
MDLSSDTSEQLSKTSLVELIAKRIGGWIAKGELKPGDRIPSEKELMRRFGVARTVVREAMARLNASNIIEIYQGKGTFVSKAPVEMLLARVRLLIENDEDLLPHLWEMREILECRIAELAALRSNEEDLQNLERVFREMRIAINNGELGIKEDDLFHFYLTRAAHNPVIEKVMLGLSQMIEPWKRLAQEQPFRSEATSQELADILEAVKKRNRSEARLAMERHLALSRGDIFESSKEDNDGK